MSNAQQEHRKTRMGSGALALLCASSWPARGKRDGAQLGNWPNTGQLLGSTAPQMLAWNMSTGICLRGRKMPMASATPRKETPNA